MNHLSKMTVLLAMLCCGLLLNSTARADHPAVYIISPSHGEVVSNPVQVRFGLRGMGVAPAGTDRENTGHHHLLIDVDELPALDQPVPSDANHRHFGKGQTEVELTLEPGEHSLQLLLGNFAHIPHNPAVVSEKITILVE